MMRERPREGGRFVQTDAVQERILAEARGLFVDRGFAEVSMAAIAAASGVTKSALYYHFANKEALFLAVMLVESERIWVGVDAAVGSAETVREQLRAVIRFFFSEAQEDVARLHSDLFRHVNPAATQEVFPQVRPIHFRVRDAIAEAAERGEIRGDGEPMVATSAFLDMMVGWLRKAEWNLMAAPPTEEDATALVGVLLGGIGAGSGG